MPTRVIRIKKGYSDGRLDLTHNGKNVASAGDTVIWQIDQNSGVRSISGITEKEDSTDIFTSPPRQQGNNWTADVSMSAKIGDTYIYAIHWIDDDGNPRTCDPKISVVPAQLANFKLISLIVAGTLGAIAAICAFKFWGGKKRKY